MQSRLRFSLSRGEIHISIDGKALSDRLDKNELLKSSDPISFDCPPIVHPAMQAGALTSQSPNLPTPMLLKNIDEGYACDISSNRQ
jgi:hypothetical protein